MRRDATKVLRIIFLNCVSLWRQQSGLTYGHALFYFNELFFEVECGRLKRNCEKINKYYWTCKLEILITSSCVAFLSRKSWKVVSVARASM